MPSCLDTEAIKELCRLQNEIRAQIGQEKVEVTLFEPETEIDQWVRRFATDKLKSALLTSDKLEREQLVDDVQGRIVRRLCRIFW